MGRASSSELEGPEAETSEPDVKAMALKTKPKQRKRDGVMKDLKILGTGCPRCKKLAETAEAAAKELGFECEITRS